MSMNFSEFKKLVGADPRNRERGIVEARQSGPEFEAVAREAEVFEDKLEAALHIAPPADLLNRIKTISQQPTQRWRRVPLALAASLVIAVGAAGLVWNQATRWDNIEDYLADHYSYDGANLVAKATAPVARADIDRVLATLDTSVAGQLAETIRFIKFCPTPDGRGAHMVIDTQQGLVTIILMPHTGVADGELIEFQDKQAVLVKLGPGSAAIIGERGQGLEALQSTVRQSLSIEDITT